MASDYCTGKPRYRTFSSLQQVLLDSPEEAVVQADVSMCTGVVHIPWLLPCHSIPCHTLDTLQPVVRWFRLQEPSILCSCPGSAPYQQCELGPLFGLIYVWNYLFNQSVPFFFSSKNGCSKLIPVMRTKGEDACEVTYHMVNSQWVFSQLSWSWPSLSSYQHDCPTSVTQAQGCGRLCFSGSRTPCIL